MKKKVVSVILAMTMVASMAMGCGSGSDTTTSDNSTTTTTTNDAKKIHRGIRCKETQQQMQRNGDLADKKLVYVFISSLITS